MLEWCRSYSADCPGAKSISYVLIMWQMMAIDLQPLALSAMLDSVQLKLCY